MPVRNYSKTVLGSVCFLVLFEIATLAFAQTVRDPAVKITQVVSGLTIPTAMAFIGRNDILVLQKNDGRVRRVINGVLQPGQVLDVAVDNASERGLLGIAVHPQLSTTPFVYLYYTESSTGNDSTGSPVANRVYRYTWTGTSLVNPTLILNLPVLPGPNHDGGTIRFGPDGKLYVVIGDLNRQGQLQNFRGAAAPDDTGVILRIDENGGVPTDNPFFALGGNLAKYYAYGIRNSFGMTFDPLTGKLWATENGPNTYDEINLVEPGFNSGWAQILGPDSRDPQGLGDLVLFTGAHYGDPKFSWFTPVAPTAAVFLDSPRLGTQYLNDLFVGDFNHGRLYRFRMSVTRDSFILQSPALADLVADADIELDELIFGSGFGGISDLKVGPDGRLYVLSISQGRIFALSRGLDSPDFDGDIRSDIGVYRSGVWFIIRSLDGGITSVGWGGAAQDIPVPADYDGDGKTDVAVYRSGVWFIIRSLDGGITSVGWGGAVQDIPVPADYDGDGKTDIAVYRNGVWFIIRSLDGGITSVGWGGAMQDIPVPTDYDGDGKADVAVYRSGVWFISRSSDGGITSVGWGGAMQDIPVPADYDGDGKADVAVYRNGVWFIIRSSDGGITSVGWGGAPQDMPLR